MPKPVPDHELILRAVEAAPMKSVNSEIAQEINMLLHKLRTNRPQNGEESRQWEIVIMELETVGARFALYCL